MGTRRALSGALVLAVVLGGGAAPVLGQREIRPVLGSVSYFPLFVGNRWVYDRSGPGGKSTWGVEVADTSVAAGPWRVFKLEGYFQGPPRMVRGDRGGAVRELGPGGDREYLWYLLVAPVGTIWQLQLAPSPTANPVADCVDGSRLVVASRDEVVKVPAGEFTRVVRVDFRSPCADAGITSEWFAPGVGLVRREETSIAGPVVSELVQAELDGVALPRTVYSTTLSLDSPRYVNNLMPPVGPGALPTARGSFALRNLTDTPVELTFRGCKSASVVVESETGEIVLRARADDGECCDCENLLAVTLLHDVLALPLSVTLSTEKGEPLPSGRYSIAVTLDTVGATGSRPSARLPFEIVAIY
jgi:hypothetical protein